MEEYNPFLKTALSRKSISVPMRELINLGLLQGKILDYGCGKGDDVDFLKYLGVDIIGYDKFNPQFKNEELLEDTYDIVTANYVLNVIKDLDEHKEVIHKLRQLGKEVYISVRTDSKAIKGNWVWNDANKCWRTPKGSYQRFYSDDDVRDLIGDVEYIVKNNSLKLFKLK